MSFKDEIKQLIAKSKTEQALKLLSERARTDDNVEEMVVISLQARLASANRDEMLGVRTADQISRQHAQINYAILSVLDDLDDSDHQPAARVPVAAGTGPRPTDAPGPEAPAAPRVAKRVFVSYAREDRKYVEELEKNMAVLRRQGYVSSWDDSKIKPGESWSADIEENLRAADVIIYLVSADFLNSDYIYNKERPWAEEMARTKGVKIISIIIRSCDWTSDPLAQRQVIPQNDLGRIVPVAEWESLDKAYTKVIKSLREII
ncbi:MAG: TIR domain-containing protein [Saprospiraceae bacterium]